MRRSRVLFRRSTENEWNISQNFTTACVITYTNWASEESPTLGCSIEISRDIYVGMSVVS